MTPVSVSSIGERSAILVTEYDYIVVGAGTAGCVVAARLTQDASTRVLLLEAGSSERTRAMTVPDAWPQLLGTPADWAGVTIGQADAGPVAYPRGRTLGGSGAINAMAHVRGHRAVYDGWAASGAAGWGFADLLPYFRRSEQTEGRDPALRGTEGPVRVAPAEQAGRHPVARAFAEALGQIGCPVTDDLSGLEQEGVAGVDLAIDGGQRVSPADAYLRPVLQRPNLMVEADCLVTRLHVEHGRCTGVSFVRDGVPARAQAGGEVIVCAGTVGSPQLLMLSGIGPAGQLRALGIDPVADIAEVGENLQDHPVVKASYAARTPTGCPGANTTTARCTRRCVARWQAPFPTCTCSRSCCRWPRAPGIRLRPRAMSWCPRRWRRTAGARSHWPPRTRRRPR